MVRLLYATTSSLLFSDQIGKRQQQQKNTRGPFSLILDEKQPSAKLVSLCTQMYASETNIFFFANLWMNTIITDSTYSKNKNKNKCTTTTN